MRKEKITNNNTRADRLDAHQNAIHVLEKVKEKQAKKNLKEVHVNDLHNTILVVDESKSSKQVISEFEQKRSKYKG